MRIRSIPSLRVNVHDCGGRQYRPTSPAEPAACAPVDIGGTRVPRPSCYVCGNGGWRVPRRAPFVFLSLPTELAWLCMPFQDLRHSFPDGLFDLPRLSYVPTARDVSGLSISVMLGSDHVPGSPFPVAVLAGVWPLRCSAALVIRCCSFLVA